MNKINAYVKLVRQMLKELGYNFVKVHPSNIMSADMENQKIFLNKEWFDKDSEVAKTSYKAVKKLYKSYGWRVDVSMGTFAILHELGHCLTAPSYQDLDKEMNTYNHKQYKLNAKKLDPYNEMKEYRKIKLERDADLTAYAIYKANRKLIKQYDKKLLETLTQ
jgi:hypothetical protein